jgi:hypothetical protein
LLRDCQTLESTNKAYPSWVIAVGDFAGACSDNLYIQSFAIRGCETKARLRFSPPSPRRATAWCFLPEPQGHGSLPPSGLQARPLPDLRDPHTPVRLPAH